MQGIDINQVITLVQELKSLIRKIEGTEDENGILNALDKLILNDLPSVLEEHQVFDDRGTRTLDALNQILTKFETINGNLDASFEVLGTTIKREHKIVSQNIASISKNALDGLQNIDNGIKGISKNLDLTPVNEAIKLSIVEAFKTQIGLLKTSSAELQEIQTSVRQVVENNKEITQDFSKMQGNFSEMIKGFNKKALIGVGGAFLALGVGLGIVGGIYIAEPILKKTTLAKLEAEEKLYSFAYFDYEKRVKALDQEYKDADEVEKALRSNIRFKEVMTTQNGQEKNVLFIKKARIKAQGVENGDIWYSFLGKE